eukprot:scaffold43465_cov54-Phaeocystis_antarctica.AAC.1
MSRGPSSSSSTARAATRPSRSVTWIRARVRVRQRRQLRPRQGRFILTRLSAYCAYAFYGCTYSTHSTDYT